MSTCRSCQAEIWWAETLGGKRMPIDAEPAEDGNIIVSGTVTGEDTPFVTVLSPKGALAVGGPRYTSHFATCPNADSHRRRG